MPVICIYNGEKYYNPRCENDMVKLSSQEKKDNSFVKDTNYKNRFFKMVHLNELDSFYAIEYWVLYKGKEFECMGISKAALQNKRVTILTNDLYVAEKWGFERFDKFTYMLQVPIEEVESLIIEKKELIGLKRGEIERRNEDIISYLKLYPNCL